jgi:hypothetical protein
MTAAPDSPSRLCVVGLAFTDTDRPAWIKGLFVGDVSELANGLGG